jgi:hypothetical protein
VNGAQVDDRPAAHWHPRIGKALTVKESRQWAAADSLQKFNRLRCKRKLLEPEVAEIPQYFTQNRWETSIIT